MWLADNDADQSSEGESEPQINGKKRYSTVSTVTVFAEAASVAGVQLRNEASVQLFSFLSFFLSFFLLT